MPDCNIKLVISLGTLMLNWCGQIPVMLSSFIARPDCVSPLTPSAFFVFNTEDAGFVAVKRQRLDVLLEIAANGFIKGECGL